MSDPRERIKQLQQELKIRNYSKSTINGYTIALWHFFTFCKGRTGDLVSLVKAYSMRMREEGRSPRGANVEIYAIRFSVTRS
jgi:hypothetical protein